MTPELDELERLALVPADRRVFEGFSGVYADCSIGRSILVGLFEVTRREWIETMDPQVVDQCRTYWHEYASLDLPATGMTRSEAHDFARRRGMRLLAAHEWIHVAVGRQTTYYPYGRVSQASWANTRELGLGRPALVGTFESGRSGSYGCYDLAGNVAEWVYGWVPSYSDFDVGSNVPWGTSTALGGSFRDLTRDLYGESRNANDTSPEFNGQTLDPRSRSSSIGLPLRRGRRDLPPGARQPVGQRGDRPPPGAGRGRRLGRVGGPRRGPAAPGAPGGGARRAPGGPVAAGRPAVTARAPWSTFRAALDAAGFRPTKSLGQNFLLDGNMVRSLVADSGVGPGDRVLEVGAGCGFLTSCLAECGAEVLAVEVDPRLFEVASGLLAPWPKVRLLRADALAGKHALGAELAAVLPTEAPWHVVSNLPYSISGPLLVLLSRREPRPESLSVLVQREVAEKAAAAPGTRDWGVLAARLAVRYRTRLGRAVPAELFWPRPRVASQVVHLERLPGPGPDGPRLAAYDRLLDAVFHTRRKTLRASLGAHLGDPARAQGLLEGLGIDPGLRPENLDSEALLALSRALEGP